jgi:DNA-binding FadR family transcriptional regulator
MAIVSGELVEGHADTIEGFVERTGASRSVVRESTRVLSSLGMLSAGRRVGVRVLGRPTWDVLDPLVIHWRLAGPDHDAQVVELRELRRAVEPEAVMAAAKSVALGLVPPTLIEQLTAAAAVLTTDAAAQDQDVFLRADSEFHQLVLRLSGNALFVRLQTVIDEALQEWTLHGRGPLPEARDVALHTSVADAIARGDGEAGAAAMREIVERTRTADATVR